MASDSAAAELLPAREGGTGSERDANPATCLSFIETQLPVSRLSKESYKERKANYSQTLTGLGKWWGRKPLVMVRAVILGLLMPASADPRKDREVFLALLTMDEEGLRRRKTRNIPLKEVWRWLTPSEHAEWFAEGGGPERPKLRKRTNAAARVRLQRLVFDRMGYDEKLKWCDRPEQIDGPSPEAWKAINAHLGTSAASLPALVRELGERRFGRAPRVGDAFCGGGSIPFEAARLGCEAFGSDLNPVAALLTWGALNIVGGGEAVAARIREAQERVFEEVDRQVTAWRIEHDPVGWRADAFLYCAETRCPECGWRVPLAPSWVIGEKTRAVAQLVPVSRERRFRIDVHSGVDWAALAAARASGTVKQSRLECPHCHASAPMAAIRGDRRGAADGPEGGGGRDYGLRLWENEDLVPRPDDVFQERLYCVRWRLPPLDALLWAEQGGPPAPIPEWVAVDDAVAALAELLAPDGRHEVAALRARDWGAENHACEEAEHLLQAARDADRPPSELKELGARARERRDAVREREGRVEVLAKSLPAALYRPAEDADRERESRVLALLRERFAEWQSRGYLPSRKIPPGAKTDEPIRTRGWTHWHHLFTPRQLLVHGELALVAAESKLSAERATACLLGLGRIADWNSRLSRWHPHGANEKSEQVFSNQALNTLDSYAARSLSALSTAWSLRFQGINKTPTRS